MYSEILRYMGHAGAPGAQLEMLISSCLEKLGAVCDPRHVIRQFPCTVAGDFVTIETLKIKSRGLAARLSNCIQVYLFAATLGADVDRLIAQRSITDSAEALCTQACAAAQIEDYCNNIEQELLRDISRNGLYLRARFSPGYGDFDIACQTDVLNILQAHKLIGVTETKTHMLAPLKSVTAVIGVSAEETFCAQESASEPARLGSPPDKCKICDKTDCSFRLTEVSP